MKRSVAAQVSLLALLVAPAGAQVPAGGDFVANAYTTDEQQRTRVAVERDGDFVVVWQSDDQDGSSYGVFGRRYDGTGAPRGAEFQVNSYTFFIQYRPAVAVDPRGNFVVLWQSAQQDGDGSGLYGQRYDAAGNTRGGEFLVNSVTTGSQYRVAVAAAPNGNFLAVWTDSLGLGPDIEVAGQVFDSSGNRVGGEFVVNTSTGGGQYGPAVAADGLGRFIVAWIDQFQDGSGRGIYARRVSNTGAPLGDEFRVNTVTAGSQYLWHGGVAAADDGRFVIVWGSDDGGGLAGVSGQRYDASGARVGGEFVVNAYTAGIQRLPSAAMDGEGNFVVAYEDASGHDGDGGGIFAQRFDAAGARRGAEFQVNAFTPGVQSRTSAAGDPAGNFVIAWRSVGQDGSYSAAVARRFGGLLPAALDVDGAGNRVWEPGESVDVRPTWRNVNGAPQTFAATLSGLTGPGGAAYTLMDGAGGYGTVASGASAACTDCYRVAVDDPSPRPARHWDAGALEGITPDVQGQQQRWRLHIGGSFTDVPPTSGFYRFVETLLHFGITSGCGGDGFCPGSPTARDQMAVFMLVAKEGPGYAPPACTAPVFGDVPASSPFCRFIEELARRGVVGGCGGGNYCPAATVTREQLAVFVLRTLLPEVDPPACVPGAEMFPDVPASSPFCKWIEELARRGVTGGCGAGHYCPQLPVTREQMSVFVTVTLGLALYGP
jgi:hypothetical protein